MNKGQQDVTEEILDEALFETGKQHVDLLLVEDDDVFAKTVERVLHDYPAASFNINRVSNLENALTILASWKPDALLLDLSLPDSHGRMTFDRIRQISNGTSIVIITGFDDLDLSLKIIRAGAQDYIIKSPEMFPILGRVVLHAIEREANRTKLHKLAKRLQEREVELESTVRNLKSTQISLIHSDRERTTGRLALGIAHEVKNPLQIIRTGLDYISRHDPTQVPQARKVLDQLYVAVDRANLIVTELLDCAAPRPLAISESDLNQVMNDSTKLMHHVLKEHHVVLEEDLCADSPKLMLDRQKISQVFVNLMMNSVQAMKDGGRLKVRTSVRSLGEYLGNANDTTHDHRVTIAEIIDSGPGIPEEILPQMFDPFFTTKHDGTGLGLNVAKAIVDMHGGGIRIINHPDGGACAQVHFLI